MAMDIKSLFWTGHAGFYIKRGDYTVFIDPFGIGDAVREKADLVLITHAHQDHCNKDDLRKVLKPDGEVICSRGCGELADIKNFTLARPGFSTEWRDAEISAIPAYNWRPGKQQFHPKSNEWVGYIIDIDGFKIYHAGDTDFIEEMRSLKGVGAALLPMGGHYVMDADEAAEAANAIHAHNSVPMHYKRLLGKEGSAAAEKIFKDKVRGALIMDEVQEPKFSF